MRNTTPQGDPIIQIGFFKATSSRLFTCGALNAQYSHVELRFSDNTVTSITRDPGRVHYEKGRTLSNPMYSCFFQIAIRPQQEADMQKLARHYAEAKEPQFSYVAMIWNFTPIARNFPMQGMFCSQYICMLLQHVSIAVDLNPLTTSPDNLYDNLRRDKRAIASYNRCLFTF